MPALILLHRRRRDNIYGLSVRCVPMSRHSQLTIIRVVIAELRRRPLPVLVMAGRVAEPLGGALCADQ